MSTVAVSLVLTLIIVSGRFIKFLSYVVAGELSPEFVFQLVAYRIPGMLVLILPLGLFLGVLLALGRMYLESEMVVLRASGMSSGKLARFALGPALLVSAVVALLSLYLSPLSWQQVEQIYEQESKKSELDNLTPGRFHSLRGGSRTSYTSAYDGDEKELSFVFVSERDEKTGQLRVVVAEAGRQVITNPETQERFVVLEKGFRYDGEPGRADYTEIAFQEYGFLMPPSQGYQRPAKIDALTLSELMAIDDSEHRAELHWRLSMPLLALIITLIAVPMSKTNPRQGRYAKLIPSILLYMTYLTLLTGAKGAIDDGKMGVISLWLIHLGFFLFALSLLFGDRFWERVANLMPRLPQRSKSS